MTGAGRAGALLVAGTLALAGCATDAGTGAGTGGSTTPAASPSSTPAPAGTGTPATTGAVPETLRFTAATVTGEQFDAATLHGRPVVLWFWAAWCPRCRAAADDVARLRQSHADRVHVVGVAGLDSGEDAMREFVTGQGIDGFVNLADDKGEVWRRFGVTSQEYYVLLDAAGKVAYKGTLTPGALRERVATLAG
ncbi:redoxin family protein [Micromonospora sp. WMMD1102]|uniref:redoxin family protein n=1 Tax=Micromonospora sp. WMMD1102 TaxID=3016105 RepID=UPI002414DE79|nr:redoxin family protein [Micromonospora sp. WMMD1102]MDG4789794.1 redoxin family protein [Micromonospora sp. WMMD1102]